MKCFFRHNFGKINTDGYQYCLKCGKAYKPHPCDSGHIWADTDVVEYTNTWSNGFNEQSTKRKKQFFQSCKACGEKRTVWQE